jgi:hypothetical protein
VALILNLATGLVSPQFHLKFDDLFETIKDHDTYPNRGKDATHFRKKRPKSGDSGSRIRGQPEATTQEDSGNPPVLGTIVAEESGPPLNQDANPPEEPPTANTYNHDAGRLQPAVETTGVRKWSRRHKPTMRLIESQTQARTNDQTAFVSMVSGRESNQKNDYDTDVYHGAEEYEVQRQMAYPIAFAASSDPDIMYLHEALKQPDRKQFVQAMVDEVTTHTERGHWKLIPISEVPRGTKILPAVWAMRRKRKILSREATNGRPD